MIKNLIQYIELFETKNRPFHLEIKISDCYDFKNEIYQIFKLFKMTTELLTETTTNYAIGLILGII